MKFFKHFLLVLMAFIGLSLTSCSEDGGPDLKLFKGIVWDGDGYYNLFTNDCFIAAYDYTPQVLEKYKNASYKECFNNFSEGGADFGVYRYDKKNDYYLIYWLKDIDEKGVGLYSTEPTIYSISVEGDRLMVGYNWIVSIDDYEDTYDKTVTYNEIKSKGEYGSLPKGVELDEWSGSVWKKVDINQ